jgi:hypothetical protein
MILAWSGDRHRLIDRQEHILQHLSDHRFPAKGREGRHGADMFALRHR